MDAGGQLPFYVIHAPLPDGLAIRRDSEGRLYAVALRADYVLPGHARGSCAHDGLTRPEYDALAAAHHQLAAEGTHLGWSWLQTTVAEAAEPSTIGLYGASPTTADL